MMVIVGQFAQMTSEEHYGRAPAAVIALPLVVTDAGDALSLPRLIQAWNEGINNARLPANAGRVVSNFDHDESRLVIDARIDMLADLDLHVTVEANEIILTYIDVRRSRFRRFVSLMAKMGASWALHELRPSGVSRPYLSKPQGGTAYLAGASAEMTAMLLTQVALGLASVSTWSDPR